MSVAAVVDAVSECSEQTLSVAVVTIVSVVYFAEEALLESCRFRGFQSLVIVDGLCIVCRLFLVAVSLLVMLWFSIICCCFVDVVVAALVVVVVGFQLLVIAVLIRLSLSEAASLDSLHLLLLSFTIGLFCCC